MKFHWNPSILTATGTASTTSTALWYALLLVVAVAAASAMPTTQAQTIGDILESNENLTILISSMNAVDVAIFEYYNYNSSEAQDTLFAPTDQAFGKIEPTLLQKYQNPVYSSHLEDILLQHSLSGQVLLAADIVDGSSVVADNNQTLSFSKNSQDGITTITIDPDATIITPNIEATNGVVHIVNSVLLPPWTGKSVADVMVENSDQLGVFYGMVERSGLLSYVNTAWGLTAFAPTNEAFAAAFEADPSLETDLDDATFLDNFVFYHLSPDVHFQEILRDAMPTIESSLPDTPIVVTTSETQVDTNSGGDVVNIVSLDDGAKYVDEFMASNGMLAIIDKILTPPNSMDIVTGQPEKFATVIELLVKAGLIDTLTSTRFYTLFLPNEGAFGKLPPSLLAQLKTDAFEPHLMNLLLYHVVPGGVFESWVDFRDDTTLRTANLEFISIERSFTGSDVTINEKTKLISDESVLAFGNMAAIHVIDAVLTPPWVGVKVLDVAARIGGFDSISQLMDISTEAKGVVDGDGPITVFLIPDDAFFKLQTENPGLTDAYFQQNPDETTAVLNAHIVSGIVTAADIRDGTTIKSIGGDDLMFKVADDSVKTVNGVTIGTTDLFADNGIIHVLEGGWIKPDGFVIPETPPPTPAPTSSGTTCEMGVVGISRGLVGGIFLMMMMWV